VSEAELHEWLWKKKTGDGSGREAWIGQWPIWLVHLDIYLDIYLWLCFYLLCLTLSREDIARSQRVLSLSCYILEVNGLFSLNQRSYRIPSLQLSTIVTPTGPISHISTYLHIGRCLAMSNKGMKPGKLAK
jgi:hypothetical protein